MKFSVFPLLLLCLTLAGCGATRPLQYPDVVPPQTAAFEPLRSDAPVVALVLGSGGRRGFAHVGVIKALEANGVPIDIVVGTSVGSLVGALYAGGYKGDELERIALDLDRARLNDFDLSMRGYIRGEQLQDFVNEALGNRSIEQLDKPFAAVATRLGDGEMIAFNRGNTGMAVRASSSIPGMFYPVTIDASEYVDGDLKQPVPISIARDMGADMVIAVDISQQPADYPSPRNVIDMLSQSIRILRQTILAHELKGAQIVIRPAIGQTPEIDTASKQRLMQNGEDAAMAALPSIREWLEQIARTKLPGQAGLSEQPETH